MVLNESKPTKGTQIEKVTNKPVEMTRGKVERPDRITWNYMKKEHKLTELQICDMDEVMIPAKVNGMAANLIRLFNTNVAKEKGITIGDYQSLNEHPELILYEGYYVRGKGGETIIKKKEGVGTSFLDEKIKEEAITEVGVEIAKTGAQKFLSGFGKFMMMGGVLVVMFGVLAIAIAMSLLVKSC